MGNSAHLQFVQTHFPPNTYKWKPFSVTFSDVSDSISPKYLIDPSTQTICQRHSIRQFTSLENELKYFAFRKQHSNCLVTVYDIILGQTPSVIVPDCMVNKHSRHFTVVLERISYRLADIGVIKFEEMTYVLEQCLKGLQVLAQKDAKNYLIDEDMICFNSEGKCKIWINQNLAKNTPNIDAVFTQQTIINNLLQILESRLDSPPPESYYRIKESHNLNDFTQALNFIQKTRSKMHIQANCIESLKSEHRKAGETDSTKANNKHRTKLNLSQQKKNGKFSLKNSRNYLQNKLVKPPKTVLSRQQTTQVSMVEIEKRNIQQLDLSRFMRSSFKSVTHKKKSIHFVEFSEKAKKKISPKRSVEKKENSKEVYSLTQHNRFPKGPLFN